MKKLEVVALAWCVQNKNNPRVFLGREGVRDFPLLMAGPDHADVFFEKVNEAHKKFIMRDDWVIAPITVIQGHLSE